MFGTVDVSLEWYLLVSVIEAEAEFVSIFTFGTA
jgi:hypothetical protein